MNSTGSLNGRTALVTGATSGIGFHTASALARLGAAVYLTGRDAKRGHEVARQIYQDVIFITRQKALCHFRRL